MRYEKKVEDV